MSKELFVSSTPHETKLAIVEEDQLTEVYFERENEYTLAGSIYKGRVTRVLPGMQSAFVDVGLERDAFLYVTDFMEQQEGEEGEFETVASSEGGRREAGGNGNRGNGEQRRHDYRRPERAGAREESGKPEPASPEAALIQNQEQATETRANAEEEEQRPSPPADDSEGSRRWRGRRRRGRKGRGYQEPPQQAEAQSTGSLESRVKP